MRWLMDWFADRRLARNTSPPDVIVVTSACKVAFAQTGQSRRESLTERRNIGWGLYVKLIVAAILED